MPDSTIDPRHSPAFQRGHADNVEHSRFRREGLAEGASVTSSRWSLADEGADDAGSMAAPQAPGPQDTDSDSDSDEIAAAEEATVLDAERRRFRAWTVAFFVIGAALIVLSFLDYSGTMSGRYMGYESQADGVFTVRGPDGNREVTAWEMAFNEYRTTVSPWLGALGFATIVGNLFRIGGRR